MAARHLRLILLSFASLSTAKFRETYSGIASDGVQSCVKHSDFTHESITLTQNCREGFKCIMENIPNYGQSILSSGSAILGFIPTVLLVLGNTNAELVRIHIRFPILALFLSITNINKRPDREQGCVASEACSVPLGPYGFVGLENSSIARRDGSRARYVALWTIHTLASIGAAVIVWQAVDIGRKGAVSWACWTDFYPVIWIGVGVLHHILSVVCMRLSLRVSHIPATAATSSSRTMAKKYSTSGYAASKHQSALFVWDLMQEGLKVEVTHTRWAIWSKAGTDLLNNASYLYGTAIFSSLTFVAGRIAIEKLAIFGVVAVMSRIVSAWVLGEMEGSGHIVDL